MKSGYFKLNGESIKPIDKPSTSHVVDGDIWKGIRKLKVLSKIQNFLWRTCNGVIPMRLLL